MLDGITYNITINITSSLFKETHRITFFIFKFRQKWTSAISIGRREKPGEMF